ncbi:MAG: hypothetical protein A2X31_04915 [Elusimicrobia bacterium GWB2_63_22]|nr:MAG: hypothetical protein A2X31_04915 [Elusimicrobia bacterium GWB2_63_22]
MNARNTILTAALALLAAAPARAAAFGLNLLTSEDIKASSFSSGTPVPEAVLSAMGDGETASYLADREPGAGSDDRAAAPGSESLGGDGTVKLYHQWHRETLEIRYRDERGRVIPEALARVRHFMRCRLTGREVEIPVKLLELIDAIQERHGGRTVTVICGYRSPELNGALASDSGGVAKKSLHMRGLAADIKVDGVRTSALRNTARSLLAGGVGYYPSDGFVHVDVGPVRSW